MLERPKHAGTADTFLSELPATDSLYAPRMGVRNFLVEGVSGTGKTAVATELQRRGLHAVHGDRELAYQGDPVTGVPTDTASHQHHLWDLGRVQAVVSDRSVPTSYLCGGSRNVERFVDLFDRVFVLEVDAATLRRRLEGRPHDEFGGTDAERELILRLHRTGQGVPRGTVVDATRPVADVVDEIVRLTGMP